ncbi:MAG: hypothetical protein KatS3mg113_0314 [Planctomycetaceae bacterium]|nr:MAG: hypothetical protein KatS3mg113_0314 [Planctomycetaceae bacterium]
MQRFLAIFGQLQDSKSVMPLMPRGTTWVWIVIGTWLLFPAMGWAQTSYPMVMSLKPTAIQLGTSATCEVQSRYSMLGTQSVFVSGTGVLAEAVPPELPMIKPGETPKDLLKLGVKFTVASDASPGVREFRLITPRGASTVGQVLLTRDPVIVEQPNNDRPDQAQKIMLPACICGTIEKPEDFDYYQFSVQAGQSLVFQVWAQRLEDKIHDLQNHVDPILILRDSRGGVVVTSDNVFQGDPLIVHTFSEAGDYLLEIRDVRYQGNAYWEYAIEIHDRPLVRQVHPFALPPAVTSQVTLSGWLLPEDRVADITPPPLTGIVWSSLTLAGQAIGPVPMLLTDQPIVLERRESNNTPDQAQALAEIPVVVCGQIESPADTDCFAFTAKKGQKLTFEVLARRYQSELDSYIRILNSEGRVLREEDDGRRGRFLYADTLLEGWDVPAEGMYIVEIRDTHLRGGAGYGYALRITPALPDFELSLDTDKTNLAPGSHAVLFARARRINGFSGEIQLHVDGLPPGVTAECGRILNSRYSDGAIVLTAAPDAPLGGTALRVWGTAVVTLGEGIPPRELVAEAIPLQEIYLPGGGRGHWPVEHHLVCVQEPGDILAVEVGERDLRLKPGESIQIPVKIQRHPRYQGNITLDVTYNHLEQIYASSLPDGVKLEVGKSKTLLTNNASEGVITLSVEKQAAPVQRQLFCVMANVSINFVMKATYSSPPLWISIEKSE